MPVVANSNRLVFLNCDTVIWETTICIFLPKKKPEASFMIIIQKTKNIRAQNIVHLDHVLGQRSNVK